jgi:2-oxoglutarate ferredoxin oxidoreductase subunit beta
MAVAVALDCSFVGRGYSGDPEHLKELMKSAMSHKGFSLVDILQPCVSFNRINTYEWYGQRVYRLGPDHNPEDRAGAFARALEWGERIPIGIIYRNNRRTFEERIPVIQDKPLVKQTAPFGDLKEKIKETLKGYY